MAAIIHVKLTGEGDFGPVDLECAIPPARLPVVMAALFGQPAPAMASTVPGMPAAAQGMTAPGSMATSMATPSAARAGSASGAAPVPESASGAAAASAPVSTPGAAFAHSGNTPYDGIPAGSDGASFADGASPAGTNGASGSRAADPASVGVDEYGDHQQPGRFDAGYRLVASMDIDPGAFITSFMGALGDLVGRLQPRGFAETILIAAIWLHYREGRAIVTRDDIRRVLRRQEHLRMPRNFSRDFHVAVTRGYLDPVEGDDGFAVSKAGYQWFQTECRK
ncbi:hypothetical protein [uncultured Thalassospira sp.]|uniref:hypothetical protein n=1 Tax=uncultured Thalassospira sp. TaxID=404382 RepID=UPI00259134E0|nr:hypothetical protein [uncultured Thalassospira sp.]